MDNKLSELSDFEINKRVAKIIGGSTPKVEEWGISRTVPDYCNNPGYAWPLIVDSKISVIWSVDEGCWCANAGGAIEEGDWGWSEFPDFYSDNENPLRAAMIVFLMMQERRNG